jgi:cell division protein FtsI/penicillin-binding protein 2
MSLTRARRRRGAVVAVLALVLGGATACSSDDERQQALTAFLDGWKAGKPATNAFIKPDGSKIGTDAVTAELKELSGELAATPPALAVQGDPVETAGVFASTVQVTWKLPAGGTWAYPTTVRMREGDDAWQVIWEPAVLHPKVVAGDKLNVERVNPDRASLLDAAGEPIFEKRPVVAIGVEPQKIDDIDQLIKALTAAFKKVDVTLDGADLKKRVTAAKPDAFVSVVNLRKPFHDRISGQIDDLPGVATQTLTQMLSPERTFARALLGTVDEAFADDVKARPGIVRAGDLVGHGGLQGRYDDRLRGRAGEKVVVSRVAPDGTKSTEQLHSGEPQPGTPVKTTIDSRIQAAADKAVGAEPKRSALVVVNIKDGAVLAAANGPNGGTENLAFTAQVPPGSTFKMVSAYGLIDNGSVTADQSLDCPETITVDGAEFRNSHKLPAKQSFVKNFAVSCNTTFALLAPKLGADGLSAAAKNLGIGVPWQVGTDAFSGKVATGEGEAARAAAAFGQGTTAVSPLAMATATAALAGGRFHQPKVVLDPAPEGAAADGPELKAESVAQLKTLMRAVVADPEGTGSTLKSVPNGPVYGKTGTAEFKDGSKDTHAWFVGWQGDIAFAAFVETGGSGADAAVPIVDRFLRAR